MAMKYKAPDGTWKELEVPSTLEASNAEIAYEIERIEARLDELEGLIAGLQTYAEG